MYMQKTDLCDCCGLTLEWDADSGEWRNGNVKFYKTRYGWAYEESDVRWDYGYKTLEETVSRYKRAREISAAFGRLAG